MTLGYFHTWQNIVDIDGRRHLFRYDRSEGRVYDITDVRKVRVVETMTRDDVDGDQGKGNGTWAPHGMWGASSIQWNARLGAYDRSRVSGDQRARRSPHPVLIG